MIGYGTGQPGELQNMQRPGLPQAPPSGPIRASWPFGPKTLQWFKDFIPIVVFSAEQVRKADLNAKAAKRLAEGSQ